jgi:hypothetical protein
VDNNSQCFRHFKIQFLKGLSIYFLPPLEILIFFNFTFPANNYIHRLDSSVSKAMSYELDSWGSILGRRKRSTQPPIQWVSRDLSLGLKQSGCKAAHSLPSSAEVKNGGAIPPLPVFMVWCLLN